MSYILDNTKSKEQILIKTSSKKPILLRIILLHIAYNPMIQNTQELLAAV